MPFLAAIPAIIPALIGTAITAVTTGVELSNQSSQSSAPKAPPAVAPPPTSITPGQQGQITAAQQNQQANTGGSLSPEYLLSILSSDPSLAGTPQAQANLQAAINQGFGLGSPNSGGTGGLTAPASSGTPSTSSGGNSITDLLTSFIKPGGGSGAPTPGAGVIDQSLQQDFRGFA